MSGSLLQSPGISGLDKVVSEVPWRWRKAKGRTAGRIDEVSWCFEQEHDWTECSGLQSKVDHWRSVHSVASFNAAYRS